MCLRRLSRERALCDPDQVPAFCEIILIYQIPLLNCKNYAKSPFTEPFLENFVIQF